jgi:TRAP-type C4-dicarboxylate transport system permease small subunit
MDQGGVLSRTEHVLGQVSHFLNQFALQLCVCLAALDLAVVMLEVLSRSAGAAIVWTEELSRWLLVWMTFIGGSIVLRERGHVQLEFFISLCPNRIKKILTFVSDLLVLVFLLFFTVLAGRNAIESFGVRGDIIIVPLFYPKLGMVFGGVLMIVYLVLGILESFLKKNIQNPPGAETAG